MIHSRKVTVLVPLQGHNEEVRRKNLRPFLGAPLFHQILKTLDKTYSVDEILINTDCPTIIAEAPRISKKVILMNRPSNLQGDNVSMNAIIAHDIAAHDVDIVLQTHCTNPLVSSDTFSRALKTYVTGEEEHDSLFSVTEYKRRFYDAAGKAINHDPFKLIRQKDLPSMYEDNGCFYIFTRESFVGTDSRIGKSPILFPTPMLESIDIGNEYTFRLAELLAGYAAHVD